MNTPPPKAPTHEFVRKAQSVGFFAVISYAVDYSFQLVDIFWVAQLGVGAPTALTIVSSLYFLILSLNEVIGVGSVAIFSQYHGAGDKDKTSEVILKTLILKFIVGVISAIIFMITGKLAIFYYELTPTEIKYMEAYSAIIWISLILLPVYSTMMSALRTIGEEFWTSIISLIALALNVIVNPILIFGYGFIPELGIVGAAWATILAQSFAMGACIYALAKNRARLHIFNIKFLKFDANLARKLIKIGWPAAGIIALYNLEQALVTALIALFPAEFSDGFGIGARILGFLFMVNFGAGLGIAVAVGNELGQRNFAIIRRAMLKVIIRILTALILLSLLIAVTAPFIISLFTTQPTSLSVGIMFLQVMAITNVGLGLLYCFFGFFEGAGRNTPPLLISILIYGIIEFPLLLILYYSDFIFSPTFHLWIIWAIIAMASWVGALAMGWVFLRVSHPNKIPQWFDHT